MAILPGSGASFTWNNSAVEHWETIDPQISFENPDATDGGMTATATQPTVQNCQITVTVKRDTASTVQNAVIADFLAKTARAWKFYENATKYYTGTSFIESLKVSPGGAKGLVTMSFTINGTSNGTAVTYN
jgi:hypothetical protein